MILKLPVRFLITNILREQWTWNKAIFSMLDSWIHNLSNTLIYNDIFALIFIWLKCCLMLCSTVVVLNLNLSLYQTNDNIEFYCHTTTKTITTTTTKTTTTTTKTTKTTTIIIINSCCSRRT